MSVSVVNGFVCFSGCDAAKARKGEDPRERANPAEPASEARERGNSSAVEFGGALAEINAASAVQPADDTSGPASPATKRTAPAVDLVV